MKSRLNLTIDDSILVSIKTYAEKNRTSVSELVENYFKEIVKPAKQKNFMDIVNELPPHNIDPKANLKELYQQDPKHGC